MSRIFSRPIISPLLKKPTLDKEELSSYRPFSNLSLISKIIERVVKSRLTYHITSNSLLNSHLSAYCKHHSTETAPRHLFAAFDTIDHDILITRLLSWFGIHGSVLSWFKSYLSSRPFRVKCVTDLSFWHTSSCGVPHGSVHCSSSGTPLVSAPSFPLVP